MHIPVLINEVIQYLDPKNNQNFVDCTLGFAGHSKVILERIKPNGKVLGIEWDGEVCQKIAGEGIERLIAVNDSYTNLKEIAKRESFGPVSGILLDLGISSWDLEQSGRGFSFQEDEPLDMRFNNQLSIINSLTAQEIINEWSEEEIAKILAEYGQERFARNIAKNIVDTRYRQPIETTFQLVEVIRKSFPRSYKFGRAHFATKTFQALRIATNNELANLQNVLPQAMELLAPGGRLVVISFHSLEDRIVKNFFREQQKQNNLQIITKKPVVAGSAEARDNSRACSAKLRAAKLIINN
ncbi:MAG: 16S rRNA (cytosine(1402)-N(4))-methyltransferase RsmH [Candidatus Gribaldobacteria bacterium]|nr:16S rRNA (cytosine(1402)-N(4))-methyltransferase RsmH [Candidatus Gribaldobacteria bacterium]